MTADDINGDYTLEQVNQAADRLYHHALTTHVELLLPDLLASDRVIVMTDGRPDADWDVREVLIDVFKHYLERS